MPNPTTRQSPCYHSNPPPPPPPHPLPSTAIADTGTTGHFLQKASSTDTTAPPIHVQMPNGHHIQSIGTTNINWPTLPNTATTAHIPELNPHSLVSIGVLCDHDCTATFNKHAVTIHCQNQPILTGPCLPNGLWSLPLQHDQTQHHANTLFTPKTQQQLVQWLHAAAFSPSPSTFLDAIQRNFFTTWRGLTPDIVRRYLPPSNTTVKGHLDQQ